MLLILFSPFYLIFLLISLSTSYSFHRLLPSTSLINYDYKLSHRCCSNNPISNNPLSTATKEKIKPRNRPKKSYIPDNSNVDSLLCDFEANYRRYLNDYVATNVNEKVKEKENLISHIDKILRLCVALAKDGNNDASNYSEILLRTCHSFEKLESSLHHGKDERVSILSTNSKSIIVKVLVILKASEKLAKMSPLLFQPSSLLPEFSLQNAMRILLPSYPIQCLDIFMPYIEPKASLDGDISIVNIKSEQVYAYSMRALSLVKRNIDLTFNGSISVTSLLDSSLRSNGYISPQLIVTALVACRETEDWQSAFQVYTIAKVALKQGKLREMVDKTNENDYSILKQSSPIVYGQTIVILSKGGAEAQTFQVVCEMLEEGIIPSAMTIDTMFLELSKRGAYKVMLSILDQLQRYRISISNTALNSILNACDKVNAHSVAIEIFSKGKIKPHQIDVLGLSVLIKCCDRINAPDDALDILEAMECTGMTITSEFYARVFAIFVKSGAYSLAVRQILRMENIAIFKRDSKNINLQIRQSDNVNDIFFASNVPNHFSKNLSTSTVPIEASHGNNNNFQKKVRKNIRPYAIIKSENQFENDFTEIDDLVSAIEDGAFDNIDSSATYLFSNNNNLDHNCSDDDIIDKEAFTDDVDDISHHPYNIINNIADSNDYDFDEKFQELTSLKHAPIVEPNIYAAVISSLSRAGLASEASSLLRSYLNRGGIPLEEMFTSSIYSYRHSRDPDAAEELFRQLQQRVYLQEKVMRIRMTMANRNLNSTNSEGISVQREQPLLRITTSAINALLTVYADSNVSIARQHSLLSEMEQLGLNWTSYTYTAVMHHFGQQNVDKVISIWDEMIKNEIKPTAAATLEMLRACVATKCGISALNAIQWIWTHSAPSVETSKSVKPNQGRGIYLQHHKDEVTLVAEVVPDIRMCSKVLLALHHENKTTESLYFLDLMRENGVIPNPSCYMIVLSTLERANDWRNAVNLLLQMQFRGIRIDAKSANLAIGACSKASQWTMVIKLFEQIPSLTNQKFIPNQFTYSQAINAACKLKNATLAMKIFASMTQEAKILPSISVSSLLIALLESGERFDESVQVFNHVVASHLGHEYYDGMDMVIDLHGLSTALARASIRSSLYLLRDNYLKSKEKGMKTWSSKNLVIITGIGRNSREWLEPILKPSIQLWLESEFEPPLVSSEVVDNPGRIIVAAKLIQAWVSRNSESYHQI